MVDHLLSAGFRTVLRWWVDRVTARPRLAVVLALLATALTLSYTLAHLRVDTNTTDMISAEVPFRQNHITFKRAFPEFHDPIAVVIDGATPERVEQAAAELTALLGADAEHFGAVEFTAGDPFFARHGLLYLSLDDLNQLADQLAAGQPLLGALAADPTLRGLAEFVALALDQGGAEVAELDRMFAAMADVVEAQLAARPLELSWRRLLQGGDDTATSRSLVLVQPRLDHATLAPAGEAIGALRTMAAGIGIDAAHGLQLRLTGSAALDHEELDSVASGALLAGALTTVGVTILLIWGLGSIRLIVATLATLVVGLSLTAALAALTVGRLNLISVTFAVLFVGLGVDFGIHLVLRYREALDRLGAHKDALGTAVVGVGGALSLSALCAALGFLSFAPTNYLGLAELGLISAGGMAVAWLTSLTVLPALLCLMPLTLRQRQTTSSDDRPDRLLRHRRAILTVATLAGLAALAALPFVRFDSDPLNLKDPTSESVMTFRSLAADSNTSPHGVEILASDLEQAEAMAARLEALPEVDHAVTLTSFVPEEQAEKLELIDAMAFYLGTLLETAPSPPIDPSARHAAFEQLRSKLDETAAAQKDGAARLAAALARLAPQAGNADAPLRELEQRLLVHLPGLLERLRQALTADQVSLESLPDHLRRQWLNADGKARVLAQPAVRIEDNAALADFAQAILAAIPTATGLPIIITEAGKAVTQAFFEASWLAFAAITLVLALVLRRTRDVVMVLMPVGLSVVFTAATAVLLGIALNFANVIVLPLLFGLGVSGAIHVVMRQRQTERPGLAATSTPRAVLFSALTTIASFGSLAVSDHLGLASMGQLLTIAILWSLVCTLIVLPCLLAVTAGSRGAGRPER